MSPVLQSPLALGADIVMHSTTKFLNGHSDGLGGALIGSKPEHKERFLLVQKAAGGMSCRRLSASWCCAASRRCRCA
jgi:cystathionine beta-lyase/cystathionine gamma-synthase